MSFGPQNPGRLRPLTQAWLLAVVLSFLGATSTRAEGRPVRWNWSNPLPHGNNIADLAYHTNHHFIQVTDHGQVYVSDALIEWEPRDTGTRRDLRGAAFLGDRLIVTGEAGLTLWSDDLQRFQTVDVGTENWLEDVATSPTTAVAVGDNAAIYTTNDGLTWSPQAVGFTNWLRGVAWGDGVFAAVGDSGLIVTSPDGIEWTLREVSDGNSANLNRISWTGNGFLVAGDQFNGAGTVIFGNASGTSWVRQTQSGATGDLLAAAADSRSSRLVAGDQEVKLASGTLVISWSDQMTPPNGAPPAVYQAAISDGDLHYLLGGRTGLTVEGINVSSDPAFSDWEEFPSPPRNWLFDVKATEVLESSYVATVTETSTNVVTVPSVRRPYVAVGDLGTILNSEDGVNWAPSPAPVTSANGVYLSLGGNTRGLVAAGGAGLLSFSPAILATTEEFTTNQDNSITIQGWVTNFLGQVWTEVTSPTNLDFLAVTANPSLFVITGQSGYIATSPDGTNWTSQVSGTTLSLSGVTSWNGGFVAVGEEGVVLTSPDGENWIPQTSGTTNWLFRVRAEGDQLVAVGSNGTVLTSTNAVSWSLQDTGVDQSLNDAIFAVGTWFVAGNQGTVLSSTNLVTWTRDEQLITGKSLFGLASHGVQLVTAGIEGIILRARLVPYLSPIKFLHYPQDPDKDDHLFVFEGELDQRFRLDRGTSVNTIVPGPILTILREDGLLFYKDPMTNPPPAQMFVAPNVP